MGDASFNETAGFVNIWMAVGRKLSQLPLGSRLPRKEKPRPLPSEASLIFPAGQEISARRHHPPDHCGQRIGQPQRRIGGPQALIDHFIARRLMYVAGGSLTTGGARPDWQGGIALPPPT